MEEDQPKVVEEPPNTLACELEEPSDDLRSQWERKQMELKERMVLTDERPWTFDGDPAQCSLDVSRRQLRFIGGVDISFVKGNAVDACACLVVLQWPDMQEVYRECRMIELTQPYISGFLAFREVRFLVEMVQHLQQQQPELLPDVIFVDGNGRLHHRGFGLACHLGVLVDIPCIGIGKKLLEADGLDSGRVKHDFQAQCHAAGDWMPLEGDSGVVWGAALQSTKKTRNPIFVSIGHRISLEAATLLTTACCEYRIPAPVRVADLVSRRYVEEHWPPNKDVTADKE